MHGLKLQLKRVAHLKLVSYSQHDVAKAGEDAWLDITVDIIALQILQQDGEQFPAKGHHLVVQGAANIAEHTNTDLAHLPLLHHSHRAVRPQHHS